MLKNSFKKYGFTTHTLDIKIFQFKNREHSYTMPNNGIDNKHTLFDITEFSLIKKPII